MHQAIELTRNGHTMDNFTPAHYIALVVCAVVGGLGGAMLVSTLAGGSIDGPLGAVITGLVVAQIIRKTRKRP